MALDASTIAAIVTGIVLAVVLLILAGWALSKKKNVKTLGKQGKQYTKSNFYRCVANPINLIGGKCSKTNANYTAGQVTSTLSNTPLLLNGNEIRNLS